MKLKKETFTIFVILGLFYLMFLGALSYSYFGWGGVFFEANFILVLVIGLLLVYKKLKGDKE